jgi:hypothetical protein
VEQRFRETKTLLLPFAWLAVDALFQETSRCGKTPFIDIWPDLVKPFLRRARSFLNGPAIDISHSPVPARRAVAPCQILGARSTTLESPLLVPAAELGGALELAAASVKE